MSNLELVSAGFSAILGTEVVPQETGGTLSIHDLFRQTYVMRPVAALALETHREDTFNVNVASLTGATARIEVTGKFTIEEVKAEIERRRDIPMDQIRLVYCAQQLEDKRTVDDYGIKPEDTIYLVIRLPGGRSSFGFNTGELDPGYDYDFTNVKDDGQRYMRGGFQYKRPYGWKRIAIKVVKRYDDDQWLGPNGIRTAEAPGEWPVSYHGTNMTSAKLILKDGYKPGPGAKFGLGIYTSPSLEMVQRLYAQEFNYSGKTYNIVLQNRVNPDQSNGHLQIIPASDTGVGADYWLSSAQDAVDVRPYGILIREVPKN